MIACVLLALPQVFPMGREAVDPTTYRSPSGAAELLVDPSDARGAGPAAYELRLHGAIAWSGELPVTLRDAVVTDEGRVLGTALALGGVHGDELHLVVLAPGGAVLRDEVHAWVPTSCTTAEDPRVRGLFHLERDGLFLAWLGHPFAEDEWRALDAATGADVHRWTVADALGRRSGRTWDVREAHAVPGTGLVLLAGFDAHPVRPFHALLAADGIALWTDVDPAAGEAWRDLQDRLLQERPRLARIDGPGAFTTWSPTDRTARSYAVSADAPARVVPRDLEAAPDPPFGWWWEAEVRGRLARLAAVALAVPEVELVELGRVALEVPPGLWVDEAAIDRLGRVVIADRRGAIHAWEPDGDLAWTAPTGAYDDVCPFVRRVETGPDGGVRLETFGPAEAHYAVRSPGGLTRVAESRASRAFLPGTDRSWVWGAGTGFRILAGEETLVDATRLPTNRWATHVDDVFPLAGGDALVLCDGELAHYDAAAEPLGSIPLPYEGGGGMLSSWPTRGPSFPDTLSATERWALVSSSGAEAWLVDRGSGEVRLFRCPAIGAGERGAMALVPAAGELWALAPRTLELVRYALP
jgi:hypothetical protein